MRGGAKRAAPAETAESEDDSEEDIPPTPAKVRLFSLFQDKETAAPLPPRCRELSGEQDSAVLWKKSSRAPITTPQREGEGQGQHHGASGSDEPGSKDQNDEESEEWTDTADANEATGVLLPLLRSFQESKKRQHLATARQTFQ